MAKLTPYNASGIYVDGYNEGAATVKNNVLAGGAPENMAVPSGSEIVLLQANQDVFYSLSATATVPDGDDDDDIYLPAGERRFITLDSTITNISLIGSSVSTVVGLFW